MKIVWAEESFQKIKIQGEFLPNALPRSTMATCCANDDNDDDEG